MQLGCVSRQFREASRCPALFDHIDILAWGRPVDHLLAAGHFRARPTLVRVICSGKELPIVSEVLSQCSSLAHVTSATFTYGKKAKKLFLNTEHHRLLMETAAPTNIPEGFCGHDWKEGDVEGLQSKPPCEFAAGLYKELYKKLESGELRPTTFADLVVRHFSGEGAPLNLKISLPGERYRFDGPIGLDWLATVTRLSKLTLVAPFNGGSLEYDNERQLAGLSALPLLVELVIVGTSEIGAVNSPTLKKLDITRAGPYARVRSINCPSLQEIRIFAGGYKSAQIQVDGMDLLRTEQQRYDSSHYDDRTFVVNECAITVPPKGCHFHNDRSVPVVWQVPDTCILRDTEDGGFRDLM